MKGRKVLEGLFLGLVKSVHTCTSEFSVLDSLGFLKPIKMTFLGTIRATGLFLGPGFAPQVNNIHLRTPTPG